MEKVCRHTSLWVLDQSTSKFAFYGLLMMMMMMKETTPVDWGPCLQPAAVCEYKYSVSGHLYTLRHRLCCRQPWLVDCGCLQNIGIGNLNSSTSLIFSILAICIICSVIHILQALLNNYTFLLWTWSILHRTLITLISSEIIILLYVLNSYI